MYFSKPWETNSHFGFNFGSLRQEPCDPCHQVKTAGVLERHTWNFQIAKVTGQQQFLGTST